MPLADDDIDWSLLDRHLGGLCMPEESAAIRQWAASDPMRAQLLASVQRIWDESGETPQRFDAEAAVRALALARASEASRDGHTGELQLVPRSGRHVTLPAVGPLAKWRGWAPVAAAVLLLAVSSVAWHWHAQTAGATAGMSNASAREYATAPGQRAEVLLIDGTRVWLNVDSRLRIPADFGSTTRRVELEGEAYFGVVHDARRPFRVHTARAVIEDIGTEFLLRAYAGDSSTAVLVTDGKVMLRSKMTRDERAVSLVRGQRSEVSDTGIAAVSTITHLDDALSWRNGQLVLRHVPLSHAVRELERWYGVDIALADSSLADVIVTASFGSDSVDDALQLLSRTLGVRYTRRGTHVRLLLGNAL